VRLNPSASFKSPISLLLNFCSSEGSGSRPRPACERRGVLGILPVRFVLFVFEIRKAIFEDGNPTDDNYGRASGESGEEHDRQYPLGEEYK